MNELFKGAVTPRDYAIAGGIVAAAALLCIGFYFVVYSGQQTTISDLEMKDADVMKSLVVARQTKQDLSELKTRKEKMQLLVTEFEKRLPKKWEITAFLQQFETFANEIGLRVQVTQGDLEIDANKETTPYKVKAWGGFHQIATFINRLERFQRYLKVSDLSIKTPTTTSNKPEDRGVTEAAFTLSTYRFCDEAEKPPAPAVKTPNTAKGTAS